MKRIRKTLVTIRIKTSCFKKAYFILNSLAYFKLLKVFQSEALCTGEHNLYLQMWLFWLKLIFIYLCNFNIAENVNVVAIAF